MNAWNTQFLRDTSYLNQVFGDGGETERNRRREEKREKRKDKKEKKEEKEEKKQERKIMKTRKSKTKKLEISHSVWWHSHELDNIFLQQGGVYQF